MLKIEDEVRVRIEELGVQAEVVIPALELNDIRRERKEYLAQTASDLYDRVVYMIRANDIKYNPDEDEDDEGPLVTLTVTVGIASMSSAFWIDDRRDRQNHCRKVINDCFDGALRMKKHFDDVVREEKERGE